ncbi:hypothetical protein JF66_07410 [Cryobacterium sp. MLB-32]|uniref:hypothetical protein n=1 Tax=Cryobacterium sp. MLB-32 TaxID=1529318 RepID=UPI0004E737D4|nr:hypothetical protein [Cryobacterium sp. MLB-32]KFF60007.1 hypothetical protein JF66_07410 [Cryobacterium sp. MLB-32]
MNLIESSTLALLVMNVFLTVVLCVMLVRKQRLAVPFKASYAIYPGALFLAALLATSLLAGKPDQAFEASLTAVSAAAAGLGAAALVWAAQSSRMRAGAPTSAARAFEAGGYLLPLASAAMYAVFVGSTGA